MSIARPNVIVKLKKLQREGEYSMDSSTMQHKKPAARYVTPCP